MIEFAVRWNWSNQDFIEHAVNVALLPVELDHAVAVVTRRAQPIPTGISDAYSLHNPLRQLL
jgi:hypothetical protein